MSFYELRLEFPASFWERSAGIGYPPSQWLKQPKRRAEEFDPDAFFEAFDKVAPPDQSGRFSARRS